MAEKTGKGDQETFIKLLLADFWTILFSPLVLFFVVSFVSAQSFECLTQSLLNFLGKAHG